MTTVQTFWLFVLLLSLIATAVYGALDLSFGHSIDAVSGPVITASTSPTDFTITPSTQATSTPAVVVVATSTPTDTPPTQHESTSSASTTPVIDPPLTPTPAISTHGKEFGISVADTLSGLSKTELNARLDDIVSLGMKWIRIDIDWSVVQRHNNSTYDWNGVDRVIAAARAHDLDVLPILVYTPQWARPPSCSSNRCPPADPSQFSSFAKIAVERYAPQGIHAWEIWNEPNMRGSWAPATDPAAYVELLHAAYTAIKNVDPGATVITGGLGPIDSANGNLTPLDFLTQIYQNDGGNYFDAIAFHPYSFPADANYEAEWNAWQQMADTNPSMRSIMLANGDVGKKIWVTEYGAPTGGTGAVADVGAFDQAQHYNHVTENLQAHMLDEAIADIKNEPWAGPFFWYSYKDLGTSDSTTENFYGLIRYDGSHKPSYDALRNAMHAASQ